MGSMKDLLGDEPFLFEARAARDLGIASVSANASTWMQRALALLRQLPPGEMTGEDIRLALIRAGLDEPHHPNAWGALSLSAVKKGITVDTGKMAHMKTKKSHARRTPVYIIRGQH